MIKFFVVSYALFSILFGAGWFVAILEQTEFADRVAAVCAICALGFLLLAAAIAIFPEWWF